MDVGVFVVEEYPSILAINGRRVGPATKVNELVNGLNRVVGVPTACGSVAKEREVVDFSSPLFMFMK